MGFLFSYHHKFLLGIRDSSAAAAEVDECKEKRMGDGQPKTLQARFRKIFNIPGLLRTQFQASVVSRGLDDGFCCKFERGSRTNFYAGLVSSRRELP